MTVSTEISSNEYTGNGVTTDFDYKFRIFKANQLSVITSDADGDNVVTLRIGTDYTVTGANKSAGGKVILTRPLANGHKISIARDIPITQETSFRNQSKFLAETHEDAFDYLTMIIQRIWGSLGSLYLKRPNILANWFDAKGYRIANLGKPKRDSDAVDLGTLKDEISGVNSTILKREKRVLRVDDMDIAALPKASDRAGNVLTFDKDGRPIVVTPASGSAVDVLNQLGKDDGLSLIGSTNYAGIRSYGGSNSKINTYGVENIFDGGDGTYLLDASDITSSDDGGTVIIDALNRRWKRQYLGKVKAEWFGAKADGVTDSTIAIQKAINNQMNSPVEMSRGEYCISDTIRVKEFKSLEGVNDTIEAWSEKSSGTVIKWIGGAEPRKAMVILGNNEVGAEPTIGSPAVCFRNVFLNGDYKVGFLAYGTYLSRDSIIDNIGGEGSTDYNFYFAKSWYATYTRIVSKNCKNNGVAFGMPLVYSDGEKVIWTSPAPLEMNRCKIDNIRSHSSGQRYSVDNPNTYNPKNDAMRMTGYGIGAGIGNSFSLTNFLSEQSGGVNLYYYTETQPVKVVDGGYLELSCLSSGLDPATELPNIIIDVSVGASNGGGQVLSNVFSNYGSGGIYTVRNGQVAKPIELINIHQPRFLKDIGNDNTIDSLNYPLKFVKLINTYYQLGYYNLLGASVSWLQFNINIRNGWSYAIPCSDTRDFFRVMFRNNAATWNPSGSITFTRPDGSTFSSIYPSTATQGEWIDIRIIDNVEKISRSGSAGSVDQNIDIKIIRLPSSQI